MDKDTITLILNVLPQIAFGIIVYIIVERQQKASSSNCQEMIKTVSKQNELYQQIACALNDIKAHLYIMDNLKKRSRKDGLSSDRDQ